jgi:hypothetical protein
MRASDVGDAEVTTKSKHALSAGRYAVHIHLIDWKADPASVDASGKPAEGALPDFVILIAQGAKGPFRADIQTFDRN